MAGREQSVAGPRRTGLWEGGEGRACRASELGISGARWGNPIAQMGQSVPWGHTVGGRCGHRGQRETETRAGSHSTLKAEPVLEPRLLFFT